MDLEELLVAAVEEVRSLLRDNRDELLAHVRHLDECLAAALAILADLEKVAALTSADRSVIGMYRETVVELRDRLEPLAGEVEDAARKLATRFTATRTARAAPLTQGAIFA